MAKYTNEFKIDISPQFEEKYKILCYKRFNCDRSIFYNRAYLLESRCKELILSSYICWEKVFFLFERDCDTSFFEKEDMSNFEKIDINFEKEWFKKLVKQNLIINSLEKKNKSNFTNVSGKLFKYVSHTKNEIITIKIKVEYDSTICLNVCTFTRLNSLKKELLKNIDKEAKYIFDGNTLSIANSKTNSNDLFVRKKNENSDHNVITFFDMCDQNKFYNSKMGILLSFLEDVNKYLKDDLSISFIPSNFNTEKLEVKKLVKNNKKLFQYIAEDKINIVNKSQNDLSIELKKMLEYKFRKLNLSPIIKISKRIIKDKINIVIVDTKEEYKNRGEKDKHQSSLDVVIQNIYPSTIQEELDKFNSSECAKLPAMKKLIFEIAIKKDIVSRKINLGTMYNLEIPNWVFIQKEKDKFYQLSIVKGELVFSEYNGSIISKNYKINKFIKIDDKIIKIEETVMTPIPDLLFYKERLEKLNKEIDVDKQVLISALNEYKFLHSSKENDINEIINNLNRLIGREVDKDEIYRCFKLGNGKTSRELGEFNDFFLDRYNILLNLNIKRNKYLEELIPSFISLQYKKEYNNYLYYIGKDDYSDFTVRISQGAVITKLHNITDSEFELYCSLLKVDFIKSNTGSKYPFPFKYLREYVNTEVCHLKKYL